MPSHELPHKNAVGTAGDAPSATGSGETLDDERIAELTGGTWVIPPWEGWTYRGFALTPAHSRPGSMAILRSDGRFKYGWSESALKGRLGSLTVIADSPPRDPAAQSGWLQVPDLWSGIEAIARWTQPRFRGHSIAVTGSVGKTSTTSLLNRILRHFGGTTRNGQKNTESGVLSDAASLTWQTYAITEVAASAMSSANFLKPDLSVVTHVSAAHTSMLHNLQGVAQRKAELLATQPAGSIAVLNGDIPHLEIFEEVAAQRDLHIVMYGRGDNSAIRLLNYDPTAGVIEADLEGRTVRYALRMRGEHMALNSLAVVAVARLLGLDIDQIREFLLTSEEVPGRGNIIGLQDKQSSRSIRIVHSAYNANRDSVEASVRRLEQVPIRHGGKRIVVLGRMLELGGLEGAELARLVTMLSSADIDQLMYVGNREWRNLLRDQAEIPIEAQEFDTPSEAAANLDETVSDGDVVLIQSSNGANLHTLPSLLSGKDFGWTRKNPRNENPEHSWSLLSLNSINGWRQYDQLRPGRFTRLMVLAAIAEHSAREGRDWRSSVIATGVRDVLKRAMTMNKLIAELDFSRQEIVSETNVLVARLGLGRTRLVDPISGSEKNRTSAADLVKLGRYIFTSEMGDLPGIMSVSRRANSLMELGYNGVFIAGNGRDGYHAMTSMVSKLDTRVLVFTNAPSAGRAIRGLEALANVQIA